MVSREEWLHKVNHSIVSKSNTGVVQALIEEGVAAGYTLTHQLAKQVSLKYPSIALEENIEHVPFEVRVAKRYASKYNNAVKRGLEFDISLQTVRNLLKAKKCFFTGLPLTDNNRTIDRVDSDKGYIKGNVVACHKQVNLFKETIESEKFDIGFKEVYRMMTKWKQHKEK